MGKPQLLLGSLDDDDSIRLNSGSTMQDGEVTITKKVYFRVPDGQNPRQYNDLDVYGHPLFPKKYSALSQDPRYKFYGNAAVKHDLDDGKYFTAELEYSTDDPNGKDEDGNDVTDKTKPWKLKPDHIEFTFPEISVPFQAAYDNKGRLYDNKGRPLMPVCNTAGDPFIAERTVRNVQMSFNFAVQKWDVNNALEYGSTINSSDIKVCGLDIPEGRGLLMAPECSYITVYEDNSSKVKWQYWNVRVVILIDVTDLILMRRFLNVGDRAFFRGFRHRDDLVSVQLPASDGAAQICRFRGYEQLKTTDGQYAYAQNGENVYCSWNQFLAFRSGAISASASLANPKTGDPEYSGGLVDPQCEQLSQMPLDMNGYLDEAAIRSHQYSSIEFRQYSYKSWRSLNLPKRGIKW